MKTILVPTDFSKSARNAAEYAVQLAEKMKAKIVLFHAYHVPVQVAAAVIPRPVSPMVLQRENEEELKKEANHLKRKGKVQITCLAKFGMAVDEIREMEPHCDLIVMGMKGKSDTLLDQFGSIATKIIRGSSIPVIAVPEKAKYSDPKKIVFSYDYDARTGDKTFTGLKELMKTFAPRIYVLNIKRKAEAVSVENIKNVPLDDYPGEVEQVYYFPEKEDLADGINEYADKYHADMIALIPHKYSLLEGMFHKSIAKKMVFHSHVPLLALPDTHKSMAGYFLG